jgi:hypothetical protein
MKPYDEASIDESANTFDGAKSNVCTNVSRAAEAVDGKYMTVDTTALPAE